MLRLCQARAASFSSESSDDERRAKSAAKQPTTDCVNSSEEVEEGAFARACTLVARLPGLTNATYWSQHATEVHKFTAEALKGVDCAPSGFALFTSLDIPGMTGTVVERKTLGRVEAGMQWSLFAESRCQNGAVRGRVQIGSVCQLVEV